MGTTAQGQEMSAGQGDVPPPPRHYSHRYTGDDDESDSLGRRLGLNISFGISFRPK